MLASRLQRARSTLPTSGITATDLAFSIRGGRGKENSIGVLHRWGLWGLRGGEGKSEFQGQLSLEELQGKRKKKGKGRDFRKDFNNDLWKIEKDTEGKKPRLTGKERREGQVFLDLGDGVLGNRSRGSLLVELAGRQKCSALDPAEFKVRDVSMENYVEWTTHMKTTDDEVGITEYASPECRGVGGLVKARWSDFRVSEIRLRDQTPAEVTDLVSLPPRPWPLRDEMDTQQAGYEALLNILGRDAANKIKRYAQDVFERVCVGASAPPPCSPAPPAANASANANASSGRAAGGKGARGVGVSQPQQAAPVVIHIGSRDGQKAAESIRAFFPFLHPSFNGIGGKLELKVEGKWLKVWRKALARAGGVAAVERRKYLRFVLAKAGWDSAGFLDRMATRMRVERQRFTMAGLKDKSGVTEQEVTSQGISPVRLLLQNKHLAGARIGNLEYADSHLRFGEHGGNRFTVILRHIDEDVKDKEIEKLLSQLREEGFVNYFGHQRFGNSAASMMPSIQVGKLLCKEDWNGAVHAALRPPVKSCNPAEKTAKTLFAEQNDLAGALDLMPRYCHDERVLLQALLRNATLKEAAHAMPHCRMFRQAYWSRVWNLAASERLRRFGRHAVQGDLVVVGGGGPVSWSHLSGFTSKGKNAWRFPQQDERAAPEIKTVSAEDEARGTYSIHDVVLPVLDGETSPLWPDNQVKKALKAIIKQDGMSQVLKKGRGSKQRCALRPLLVKPIDLHHRVLFYTDRDRDLTVAGEAEDQEADAGKERGKWRALEIEFTLPPSCYATMLLREVMRSSTHPSEQFRLRLQLEATEDRASGHKWQARLKTLMESKIVDGRKTRQDRKEGDDERQSNAKRERGRDETQALGDRGEKHEDGDKKRAKRKSGGSTEEKSLKKRRTTDDSGAGEVVAVGRYQERG